jgi:ComF family protein
MKKALFQGFTKKLKQSFLRYNTQACALCACSGRRTVCGFCLRNTAFRAQKCLLRCHACAKPLPHAEQQSDKQVSGQSIDLCADCVQKHPVQASARVLCDYEYPWDELVQQMKFNQRIDVAHWFGHQLAKHYSAYFDQLKQHAQELKQALILVPVPLSQDKLDRRGFNQSAEIALMIAKAHQISLRSYLEKNRSSQQQSDLPKHLRAHNLRGVFKCVESLSQTQVILVDDVYTTGSTITEAARVLKKAGATQVHVITACRTNLK